VATVAADGEGRGDFDGPVGRVGEDAGDCAVRLLDEACGLPTHAEGEGGEARGFGGEEVEEVPLRHEGDELGVRGKVREVGHGEGVTADVTGEAGKLRVRELEKFVEEPELVEDFHGGGVNGVAAEVTEEVGVFFEDGDGNALPGEQVAEHDACGASADDAAGGCEGISRRGHLQLSVASRLGRVKIDAERMVGVGSC
jgi:hypothetical protein